MKWYIMLYIWKENIYKKKNQRIVVATLVWRTWIWEWEGLASMKSIMAVQYSGLVMFWRRLATWMVAKLNGTWPSITSKSSHHEVYKLTKRNYLMSSAPKMLTLWSEKQPHNLWGFDGEKLLLKYDMSVLLQQRIISAYMKLLEAAYR